jgi:hypothetical protein
MEEKGVESKRKEKSRKNRFFNTLSAILMFIPAFILCIISKDSDEES